MLPISNSGSNEVKILLLTSTLCHKSSNSVNFVVFDEVIVFRKSLSIRVINQSYTQSFLKSEVKVVQKILLNRLQAQIIDFTRRFIGF